MPQENVLQSQNVQNTMLLPLWDRATVSRLYPGLLHDEEVVRIIERMPYDFDAIAKSFGEYGMLNFAVRARKFDDAIRRYLTSYPEATVVNIGAGMDTTFSRVDNGKIKWYDLDLPDASAFRQKFIPEGGRNRCIAKSNFDYSWFNDIEYDSRKGAIFLSGGVFYYLVPVRIKELVSNMAERFPGGLLGFDAESPLGLSMANRMVKKTGNHGAEMIFAIKTPAVIKTWSPRITGITAEPYHKGIQRDRKWSLFTRLGMSFGDLLRMIWIISVSFGEEAAVICHDNGRVFFSFIYRKESSEIPCRRRVEERYYFPCATTSRTPCHIIWKDSRTCGGKETDTAFLPAYLFSRKTAGRPPLN